MSKRIEASDIVPGMALHLTSGSWIVEKAEEVASTTGPLIRLMTRGIRTGAVRSMTLGPRRAVRFGPAPKSMVMA